MSGPVIIQKNRREWLRVALDEFKGRMLVSCRVWYQPNDGSDLKPGRDGWSLSVERLPELIAGLQQLEAEARAKGLLPGAQQRQPPASELVRDWMEGGGNG